MSCIITDDEEAESKKLVSTHPRGENKSGCDLVSAQRLLQFPRRVQWKVSD